MELKDTISGMISADYKERFKAEYTQVTIRFNKLCDFCERYENDQLDFSPDCPLDVLQHQLCCMAEYLTVLEERAEIEGIDLE